MEAAHFNRKSTRGGSRSSSGTRQPEFGNLELGVGWGGVGRGGAGQGRAGQPRGIYIYTLETAGPDLPPRMLCNIGRVPSLLWTSVPHLERERRVEAGVRGVRSQSSLKSLTALTDFTPWQPEGLAGSVFLGQGWAGRSRSGCGLREETFWEQRRKRWCQEAAGPRKSEREGAEPGKQHASPDPGS